MAHRHELRWSETVVYVVREIEENVSFLPRFEGVSCGYRNRNEAAVLDIVEVGVFSRDRYSIKPTHTFAFTPDSSQVG